jgi:DNA (cytosine-5)-methyltransferase 1
MAFDRLGIDYECVGISEIDKYAIKSYMAIHGDTKNFGDITKIKGHNLPEIDVFTYSFPCTDLSKAGQQKGLTRDTRSGLVYEVLRILWELKELNNLPKVLIMENVVDLVQVKFIKQFNEIQAELETLGYTNYTETMNAKDYGVAQNRDRVFMVSILGDYYYEFPKPLKLENA